MRSPQSRSHYDARGRTAMAIQSAPGVDALRAVVLFSLVALAVKAPGPAARTWRGGDVKHLAQAVPMLLLLPVILVVAACTGGKSASARDVQAVLAAQASGRRAVVLHVPDMVCPGCVATISAKLEQIGVTAISGDVEHKTVRGYFVPSRLTPAAIRKAVEDVGYTVESISTGPGTASSSGLDSGLDSGLGTGLGSDTGSRAAAPAR